MGALRGESVGRAPLPGTLNDMLSRAKDAGVCFNWGPILGNMEGMLLSQGL